MPTAKKKTAKRSPRDLKPRRKPEDRAIHILMPYILGICALFLALCFLLGEEKLGLLGKISVFLQGLFSWGAYATPLLLTLHAIFYKRDLGAGSHLYKFWFSLGDLTFLGVLAGLFSGNEPVFNVNENWSGGVALKGGGVLGGFLHKALDASVGLFTPVITFLAVLVFTSFLFGTTPADLIRGIFIPLGDKMKEGREERRDRQAEDRQAREEAKMRLAEERAREKYNIKAEEKALREEKKRKKKEKCLVNLENGEDVTGPVREDFVPDDQQIYPAVEEEPEPVEEEPEIIPLEQLPSLQDELAEIFSEEEAAPEIPKEELAAELISAEAEIRGDIAEKHGEEELEVEKTPLEPEPAEPEKPEYRFPPISLLQAPLAGAQNSMAEQENTARKLVETLASFGVKTSICGIAKGPAVTRYELQPQRGVRVRSIVNLTDDIALSLAAGGIRIEAPIPGKEAVGIEVPNKARETVYVRELIQRDEFSDHKSRLHCCLGKDVAGKSIYCDLSKMPHILIAGATGMGKSVCLNSLIVSILYHATPEEVQMILIDPKKVEMGVYNRIPHLIVPVVSDAKKAAGALNWAVLEMEKRFIEMEDVGVRDIKSYNEITRGDPEKKQMSQIVIIIDELADLMMTARDEVETSICRLAQKARAAGMHLVIGTQRPSVDVITGLIKANVPSRIACTVASQVDSRTIIDIQGAEKLLGLGDMLYAPVGSPKPLRVQGCFVSEKEIEAVCDFIRQQREAVYDEAVSNLIEREAQKCGEKKKGGSYFGDESDPTAIGLFADKDPLLEKAIDIAIAEKKVSTSLLQRKLSVGYARAAKLIDFMAEMKVVGDYAGSKPREVLWSEQFYAEYKMRALEETPIQ
ncbi:MAG: DNA translocase FtsK [Clostridia bacterium]|nr:DNA translocase FtsK [Clostridia bacterium]